MRILHLLDERWDSGLTAYAIAIAKRQRDAGDDVAVGVRPGKTPERLAREAGLPTRPVTGWRSIAQILARERWDVVNAHTGSSHTPAALLRTALGRPFGVHRGYAVVRTRGDARELRTDPLARFLYRRTDGVIAASDHIGRQYEEWMGFDADRLATVYPSLPADPEIRPAPADTVGILGRLDPVKGHVVFLEAAAIVLERRPGVRFRVGGAEAGVPVALLRNQADALGIAGAVSFEGFQPSALEFMRGCGVGVVASVGSEEISRACLEWMSVGRPVVATIVGCLPELVETGDTGLLVPPNDGLSLGRAILSILTDPARAADMGRRGHERIGRHFTAARQLEATRAVYEAALGRVRRHG